MIYEFPDSSSNIRQGDIFVGIPRVELSLRNISVVSNDGERIENKNWTDVGNEKEVSAIVAMRPVAAIVASQDCDNIRERDITLCEIKPFEFLFPGNPPKTVKAGINQITQQSRKNLKWFYLPPDNRLGFKDRMAVDFTVTISLPREDLVRFIDLRKGRLVDVADEHFRERIAEFFRRYPYDEWYPLSKNEFEVYQSDYPSCQPFPWQK